MIPPVRLSTFALSRDGVYMAGGTLDGRIFLWEVSLFLSFRCTSFRLAYRFRPAGLERYASRHCRCALPLDQRAQVLGRRRGARERERRRGCERLVHWTVRRLPRPPSCPASDSFARHPGRRLLNATPMNPPAPYATLSDHTLPITDICVGLGSFPHCRVMTSSMDSTVKVRRPSNVRGQRR